MRAFFFFRLHQLHLPPMLARTHSFTLVGIDAIQTISGGSSLRILIEKDLECIDAPVEESQEDAFARQGHGVACSSTSIVGTLVAATHDGFRGGACEWLRQQE